MKPCGLMSLTLTNGINVYSSSLKCMVICPWFILSIAQTLSCSKPDFLKTKQNVSLWFRFCDQPEGCIFVDICFFDSLFLFVLSCFFTHTCRFSDVCCFEVQLKHWKWLMKTKIKPKTLRCKISRLCPLVEYGVSHIVVKPVPPGTMRYKLLAYYEFRSCTHFNLKCYTLFL